MPLGPAVRRAPRVPFSTVPTRRSDGGVVTEGEATHMHRPGPCTGSPGPEHVRHTAFGGMPDAARSAGHPVVC